MELRKNLLYLPVIGVLLVFTGTFPVVLGDDTGSQLTGPNVCSRSVFESGYYTVNVSYSCWEEVYYSDCPGRRTTPCWRYERSTCYKLELRCDTRWVEKRYCCSGYQETAIGTCERVINCGLSNGGCDHLCVDDDRGNQVCRCFPGYMLNGRTQCVDVDECLVDRPCDQQCNNLDGSYFCSCNNGYRLSTPDKCEEIDECALGNGGCQHICHNTDGAFYCECRDGYERVEGFMCKALAERTTTMRSTTTAFVEPLDPNITMANDEDTFGRHVGSSFSEAETAGYIIGGIAGLAMLIAGLVLAVLLVRRYGCCCCVGGACCCPPRLTHLESPPPYSEAVVHDYEEAKKTPPNDIGPLENMTYDLKSDHVIRPPAKKPLPEKPAEEVYDDTVYHNRLPSMNTYDNGSYADDVYEDVNFRNGEPLYDNSNSNDAVYANNI